MLICCIVQTEEPSHCRIDLCTEMMEDVSATEGDKSNETVEEDAKMESTTTGAEAVADISAAGDAGSVDTDTDAGERAAGDSPTEETVHVVGASATVESAVMSEDEVTKGDVVSAAAADDDVAGEISHVETDETNETATQIADETVTVATSDSVEEKPEADKDDAESKADATIDRVEHVTSKADKVTVSVEIPETCEVTEGAVDAAAVTKSEASDAATVVNKTTQDVITMAGNDELKFGVLIVLVRVGQLSNKDVVDSVLCLVSTSTVKFVNVLEVISTEYYIITVICKENYFSYHAPLWYS